MNLRTLAYKNVKYHLDRYVAYFFSCTFAVWLFFQYLSLLLHPIMKEEVVPDQFVTLMYLVQLMILLFSFLFIGYSQSAFSSVVGEGTTVTITYLKDSHHETKAI